ncbi:FAD/NAD(P)-binding domain-containing protein [Mollisia scopiformis]|uniref:FAD/NAD(P)-binding domain-containing protein n=1 Tax=Mollisia scopiformis TaxID=149040 RepID=A0A194X0X1_MOLSC|nr:FAD/NAD(P)-binding domain-containing protein [Mollisia scopiformis]KUJ13614.1 FAD/NAD(P)-binding domain-containing protein [Mollisia scopiformis]
MTNIVILGASFAGVSSAHRILKQAGKTGAKIRVTLVSPNTHFYWNIALPRAVVPGQLSDEKVFQPIAPGFKQYPAGQFEFIVASAKSLGVEAKKVHLEILGSDEDKVIDYDFLILATGTSTKGGTPFKTLASTEATKDGIHNIQAQIKKAKTIVLAGAGATGVEIAGELGFKYGTSKEIILISKGPTILEAAIPSVQKVATQLLQNLKVKTKLKTQVVSSVEGADGRHILELSSGEKLIADVYLPTFGVAPNSSYIPKQFLNDRGFVIVDDYLKVKGADNVWAIGDVSDREPPQFLFADGQSAHIAKNIIKILSSQPSLPYKDGVRGMGLTVGRKAGTGHLGNVKLPGFLVHFLRKNLFIDKLAPTVSGSAY